MRRRRYERSGVEAPPKAPQLGWVLTALTRRSSRQSEQDVEIMRGRGGEGHRPGANGARREIRPLRDTVVDKRTKDASIMSIAQQTLAKSREPVTNEGGIVRFALSVGNEHTVNAR